MIDFDIRLSGHPVPAAEREAILTAPGSARYSPIT